MPRWDAPSTAEGVARSSPSTGAREVYTDPRIKLEHYGADLPGGPLTVREGSGEAFEIVTTTRAGVTKSVELPLRFYIKDNEHVGVR